MTNTDVLVEGVHGRRVVDEPQGPMDLSVPQGRKGMGQGTQGLCGYGSSDAWWVFLLVFLRNTCPGC